MTTCATPECTNLIDADHRCYCSRCRPGQTAEQHLADVAAARARWDAEASREEAA